MTWKLGTHHAATCPAGSTGQFLPTLPKSGCSWSISPGLLQALQKQQWHFLSFLPPVLGYNVGCNQGYVFYHYLHKLLKPGGNQCCLILPWHIPDNSLWGYLLLMDHQGLTKWLIKLHRPIVRCSARGWGNQAFLPGYNLRFATPQSALPTGFPEDKSYITTTRPSEGDQTLLQDHRFNRTTSITLGGLLPPPWPTGCQAVSWLCQVKPAFPAFILIFLLNCSSDLGSPTGMPSNQHTSSPLIQDSCYSTTCVALEVTAALRQCQAPNMSVWLTKYRGTALQPAGHTQHILMLHELKQGKRYQPRLSLLQLNGRH